MHEYLMHALWVLTIQLEYDTDRAGTFEPLKHFPSDKTIVLGLISSKTPVVEDIRFLRDRVEQAAQIMSHSGRTKAQALKQ
jgi:methionine synthase II (cobalamin-independent)